MKRREIIAKLMQNGWWLLRQGSNHEIWTNGDLQTSLPRHKEVNEYTARDILRTITRNQGIKK